MTGDIFREKPYIYASTDLSIISTYDNNIGKSVRILYDLEDSKKFVLKNEDGFNYFVSILFILLGLIVVGLGISYLLGYLKMD